MSESRQDYSYGFVVVFRAPEGDRFLLVRQADHFGFPKGHPEGDETPVLTAKRELMEECSVSDIEILPGKTFRERYTFEHNGVTIEKENLFFLAFAKSDACKPQEGEILECGYYPCNEAREKFSFESARHIFDEVQSILEHIPRG